MVDLLIKTAPPGAVVIVDESQAPDKSPVKVQVMAGQSHEVRIQLAGYQTLRERIPVAADDERSFTLIPEVPDAAVVAVDARVVEKPLAARRDAGRASAVTPPVLPTVRDAATAVSPKPAEPPKPPVAEPKPDAGRDIGSRKTVTSPFQRVDDLKTVKPPTTP
jgi:hypothetical protein